MGAQPETVMKSARTRAEGIVRALNERGVSLDRLTAQGYEAEAPFATKPLFLDRAPTKGAALRVSER